MGRISDIVLRGLQFEAEQETRELENEGRRLQMDKIVREKVAVSRRMNPKFAESWGRFTNPETPTSELGKLMADIPPEDFPDLINDRNTMLAAHARNEFAVEKYVNEWQQKFALQEKRFELQEQARKQGERERDERLVYQQGQINERTNENVALRKGLATNTTRRQVRAAELAEANRRAGDLKEHQNQISLLLTSRPFDALSAGDADQIKILKNEMGDVPMRKVRDEIIAAGTNAAELIRAGVKPEAAYLAVRSGITIDPDAKTITRIPVAVPPPQPEDLDENGLDEDDVEAYVEKGVANALNKKMADTPELREALRKRAMTLLGGK